MELMDCLCWFVHVLNINRFALWHNEVQWLQNWLFHFHLTETNELIIRKPIFSTSSSSYYWRRRFDFNMVKNYHMFLYVYFWHSSPTSYCCCCFWSHAFYYDLWKKRTRTSEIWSLILFLFDAQACEQVESE